ncbi:hypothetical protein JOB18_015791 [Solea senegalensis]|uniref:Uncharacterized protein n=1 Tax=Solea senegalensis TaxID=28829 RepID=A0AAV6QDN1_SOLSE|nr:hypothetical protein JOB18_015791 [Solea senegalensis]
MSVSLRVLSTSSKYFLSLYQLKDRSSEKNRPSKKDMSSDKNRSSQKARDQVCVQDSSASVCCEYGPGTRSVSRTLQCLFAVNMDQGPGPCPGLFSICLLRWRRELSNCSANVKSWIHSVCCDHLWTKCQSHS